MAKISIDEVLNESDEAMTEAERILDFISCLASLISTADLDKYGYEVQQIIDTLGKSAEHTREKISSALILLGIARKQPEV